MATKRAQEKDALRRALKQQQKFAREVERLESHQFPAAERKKRRAALRRSEKYQQRDLEETLRAEDRQQWDRDPSILSTDAAQWSERLTPRQAVAMNDVAACRRWNQRIAKCSNKAFVALIRDSHRPTALRPVGVPAFAELLTIAAFQNRVVAADASTNTALKHALRAAIMPTTRGRRKAITPAMQLKIARRRIVIESELRTSRRKHETAPYLYRGDCTALVKRYLPEHAADDQAKLVTRMCRPGVNLSVAAAMVVAKIFGVGEDRARRGRVKRKPRRRRPRTPAEFARARQFALTP